VPHVALVHDPDPARRAAFRAAVRSRFAAEAGVVTRERSRGAWWLGWAAASHVPTTLGEPALPSGETGGGPAGSRSDGGVTLLLGDAFDTDTGDRLDATGMAERLRVPVASGTVADGFFLALHVEGDRLAVMTDPLGLLPVYHVSRGPVVVVATSPHLATCHPSFPLELDPRGLVGLLLTQDPVADRTLVAGPRRLGPGASLEWSISRGAREITGYRLPATRDESTPADEQIARVGDTLAEAVRRELAGRTSPSYLLSGGRDSRLLAGLAAETARGGRALVMGRDGDYEVETARRVAAVLGLEVATHDPAPAGYLEAARRSARWEPLVGGVSDVHVWDLVEPLARLSPACVNGYVVDSVVGGTWFYSERHPTRSAPFSAVLEWANAWGVPRDRLERLLRPELAALVRDVIGDLERAYTEASADPSERPWRFIMTHANRYRVGGNAWRVSFGAWPVMPALHVSLLDAVASADQRAIAQRRAQDEILRRRLPALARIPLVDRNADLAAPLRPSWRDRLAFGVRARLGPAPGDRARRRERRVNWRAFDFNHPGWREIRRSAEPYRDCLSEFFRMEEVARYLPGPEETPVSHTFFDLMGPQVLVGLILWAREHR